ncbi:group II intron reverse transcriptase/maturase [Microseira sp. BLCC-F43]|jgi:RNA-directed DNA polymerase|uniref:group II intron reverse transcriptase/maturase n=1 Tax=Microseira sp. BLCC-F43 TaxID=3153602 RepID=UPI0035BAAD54
MNTSNAELTIQDGMTEEPQWNQINWKKLERRVYKLQKRIYRASERGDTKAVRKLQKTLLHSWSAKCLAVRRVTQDNRGKKTTGVDGVKSLTPKQRLNLVGSLKLSGKSKPTRRVWIPKPGTEEKRPLGIPVMNDRALQALTKLALEPEWEACFEPNSYGPRPGRSCHDAIEAIFKAIRYKPKFVLDADISKCFDRINHSSLLKKVNTFPTMGRQIKAWLKAGVMDKGVFEDTEQGTPQGGVISPRLANIALQGMENRIKQYATTLKGRKADNQIALSLVRYADDFVILHEKLEVILECQKIIQEWLKQIGLELKPAKTRITHTLNPLGNEQSGFNFLGFTIRQFEVGKYQSGKNAHGSILGFKTIIKPTTDKVKLHLEKIAKTIDTHKAAAQAALISSLNPIIRGWSNYYSTVCSKEVYTKLDSLIYAKLRRWGNRRHPNKTEKWVANKYWQTRGSDRWIFATRRGGDNSIAVVKHSDTPIVRHTKVKGKASPYDGNLVYWSTRMGTDPEVPSTVSKLLKRHKGKCPHCGLNFKPGDSWEVDHIEPKAKGGKNRMDNLQLLHRHCHDTKSANDLNGMHNKHPVTEEPCEAKVSRTVLKTRRRGDSLA